MNLTSEYAVSSDDSDFEADWLCKRREDALWQCRHCQRLHPEEVCLTMRARFTRQNARPSRTRTPRHEHTHAHALGRVQSRSHHSQHCVTHAHSIMQYQGCPVSLKSRESAEDLRPPVAWKRERHNLLHEARRPSSQSKREGEKFEMRASPASPESSLSSSALSSPSSSSRPSNPSTPEARKRQPWDLGTPSTQPLNQKPETLNLCTRTYTFPRTLNPKP
jgi:hypothetical protein